MQHPRNCLVVAMLVLAQPTASLAGEIGNAPVNPYVDARYRLELVDQDGFAQEAVASTLRVRAGLKTVEFSGFSAVIEGEAITDIGKERYNDTVNGRTQYPVVADPSDVLLNQAYVRWHKKDVAEAIAGRQAVNLDNQRWIGSVGWRQNDQTLDAARVTVKPVKGLSLGYGYAWRVNRIFGPDSPQGIFRDTGIHLFRVAQEVKAVGTVSTYAYLLDIPSAPLLSSQTYGVRLTGTVPVNGKTKLLYAAEYARQSDHGRNPANFGLTYLLLEPGVSTGPLTLKLGYERLEGNGAVALQTPLATLHAFNGWADKFLTTPVNGLRDVYADATVKLATKGALKDTSLRVAFHDFRSTRASLHYGREWDVQIARPIGKHFSVVAKYARYDAVRFATDTSKFWFGVEAKY